jgi:hypothetical protein
MSAAPDADWWPLKWEPRHREIQQAAPCPNGHRVEIINFCGSKVPYPYVFIMTAGQTYGVLPELDLVLIRSILLDVAAGGLETLESYGLPDPHELYAQLNATPR